MLFLPSPMGKGVVPDSSVYNISSARSTALKEADVVLVLGARLNWVLHFGQAPKWNPAATVIQVDICADELGKNGSDSSLALVGDIALVVGQLVSQLRGWKWQGQSSTFYRNLQTAKSKNEDKAAKKAAVGKVPMTFEKVFDTIRKTLDSLSKPEDGGVVYVSEGANAMDISRSMFTIEHPRIRLDAGTYATMGVGLGYAIAAYAAYNYPQPEGSAGTSGRKKIVAIEGDSAFGMSGMEVETMSRYQMDVLIFVMNNSGLYRGDTDSAEEFAKLQKATLSGAPAVKGKRLSSMSLGYQTNYEKLAEMCGGIGIVARTPDEVKQATEKGYKAQVPVVVNVIVESGAEKELVSILFPPFSLLGYALMPPRSIILAISQMLTYCRTFHGSTWHRPKRGKSCETHALAHTGWFRSIYYTPDSSENMPSTASSIIHYKQSHLDYPSFPCWICSL